MMFQHTQKVTIVSIDSENIERDRGDLRAFYATLDRVPSSVWANYFDEQWASLFFNMRYTADIVGRKIRVVFAPDYAKKTVAFLKQVIERTNNMIDEHNLRADSDAKRTNIEERRQLEVDRKAKEELRL